MVCKDSDSPECGMIGSAVEVGLLIGGSADVVEWYCLESFLCRCGILLACLFFYLADFCARVWVVLFWVNVGWNFVSIAWLFVISFRGGK